MNKTLQDIQVPHAITKVKHLSKVIIWCFLLNALSSGIVYSQGLTAHNYPQDGYAIEVPASWQERIQPLPNGSVIRAFWDSDKKLGAGFCHVQVQLLDKKRMPTLASMSEKKRREYHRRQWTTEDWMQIFPNLASAQNFRVVNSFPTEIGAQLPASALDFGYSVPGGYFYRVRAHAALTAMKGFSLWCTSIGHTAADADNNFRRYLGEFQTVAAKFRLINN